ncbi:MAG TPA: flagellar assembly protein FliW [Bryobacteraceae bacterium]|nr:flagellar assembly protein FliW [Bryobacteraceae bacterium]
MPTFKTKNFGPVSYQPGSVVEFPNGLPGFEEQRQFLALNYENTKPLVFLQSLADAGLCFITLPVKCVDPDYRLQVSDEDLGELGFAPGHRLQIGPDVACLIVVSLQQSGPTANLLAPVLINTKTLKAVQAIAPEPGYSHQHPLVPPETAVCS